MKRSKLFFLPMLAFVFGMGIAGAALASKQSNKVDSAEAATTKRIFLDCTQHGDYDKEQSIGIQYYTGSYIKKEATKLADNYWYVDVPSANLTKVQFFRCDKGNVNNNYNWQWEGNPAQVNYYSVKGWDNNGDWSSANGADETYQIASTTPSTATKRVWVDPKDSFYDGSARAALRVFGEGITETNYILGGSSQYVNMTHESTTQYFFYVDIPVNADCQLVRLHNAFNIIWTYSTNFSNISTWNTTLIMFSWNAAADLAAGGIDSASNYTVEYAKKVLDGYSTCVNSDVNGYGAYANLNTNILSKLGSAKLNQLRAATFTDPVYGTRTYGDKIDLMANPSGQSRIRVIDQIFGGEEKAKTNIVVIIVSAVTLVSVAAFFILKKKRA